MNTERMIEEETEKPIPRRKANQLWPFTDMEERRIRRAIRASIEFMENYGQAPEQPMIDLSHYETSNP